MLRTNLRLVNVVILLSTIWLATGEEEKSVKCYDELGCFPTDGPWTSIFRPRFPAPLSPEECGTYLIYFDRKTGKSLEDGSKVTLRPKIVLDKSKFDGKRTKTYFITHGFIASGNSTWMSEMKDALLYKDDANVFLVDWGKGADTINYFQAASNTRVVGAELARFIKYLIKTYSLNPKNIHLIGHSLGAQISSYAGKLVPGIGRITGLDPAQPGFEGTPSTVRLDKTDADFVDVFHTNCRPTIPTFGFGMISAVGHVDIYFNGGLDQPDCLAPQSVPFATLEDLAKVPFKVLGKWISCSHTKATQYFTATINNPCKIWARQAGRLRSIVNAVSLGNLEPITAAVVQCSRKTCLPAGFEAPIFVARGMFAATTVRNAPYCDTDLDQNFDKNVLKQIATDDDDDPKSIVDPSSVVTSSMKKVDHAVGSVEKRLEQTFGKTANNTGSIISQFPFLPPSNAKDGEKSKPNATDKKITSFLPFQLG